MIMKFWVTFKLSRFKLLTDMKIGKLLYKYYQLKKMYESRMTEQKLSRKYEG